MADAHDRIYELAITCDESADTVLITDLNFYRNRAELDASNPFNAAFTADAAAATTEVELGEVLPPPTHIRLVSTFQA